MSAIPSPALALTRAFDRLELSSARVVRAARGDADDDIAVALVELVEAKAQARAAIQTVQFSDEMWKALLELGQEPHPR